MPKIYAQQDIQIETPNGKKEFKKGDVVIEVDSVVDLQQLVSLATTARIGDTKPSVEEVSTKEATPEVGAQEVTNGARPRLPKNPPIPTV